MNISHIFSFSQQISILKKISLEKIGPVLSEILIRDGLGFDPRAG